MYTLFARPGWGSVLVEAQLAFYGLDYELDEVEDLFRSAEARERLAPLNPVAQVPTLKLPDGEVMTESVAITLHLADMTGSDALVPAPGDPARPRFLRWLVFLVANIYPTFTFADDPSRFVADEGARKGFRGKVDTYARGLWEAVDRAAVGPWFLGERFSAMDIFIAGMTHWRPGRPWFAEHTPKLAAIAGAADARPDLDAVWRRNFTGHDGESD